MLACPICSEPLNAVDNGVACPAGHRFDRARQGYLNLLPVQHKNSRDPGDNLAMVEARRDFLNAGHYAPVAKRLAELAARIRAAALARHRLWRGLLHRANRRGLAQRRRLRAGHLPGSGQTRLQTQPAADLVDRQHGARAVGLRQLPVSRQRLQPAGLGRSQAPAQPRRRPDESRADQRPSDGIARAAVRRSARVHRRQAPGPGAGRHGAAAQRNPGIQTDAGKAVRTAPTCWP